MDNFWKISTLPGFGLNGKTSTEYSFRTLLDLADLLRSTNKTQEALAAYKRAIEHDSTFEAAYLHAMDLYRNLNDRVSAIRLYEAYTKMMVHELDLPPSPEMEAVYKQITR